MRITKSELKEMIREALREELATNQNSSVSNINEDIDTEYYAEVRAFDKDTVEDYDDEDNAGATLDYGYWGTKEAVIKKLNQIAETCMFSFVFIYKGDPDDNNCVFEASDTDTTTDEEFDNPVIWKNNFIKTAPFMKDFYNSKP